MQTPTKEDKKEFTPKYTCTKGLLVKEDEDTGDILVQGLVATTHPDRVGDILSEHVIDQIVNSINDESKAGGNMGAYRSVSLFHDWVIENDPTLDEAAFILPTASKVKLEDGHYGAKVEAKLNKYYNGDMEVDEIKYRIDNGQIAGFSIEYDTTDEHVKKVDHQGTEFRFIEELSEYGGIGFARARKIANPNAVIYKEISDKVSTKCKEDNDKMGEDEEIKPDVQPEQKEVKAEVVEKKEEPVEDQVEEPVTKEEPETETKESVNVDIDKIVAQVKEQVKSELQVKSKIVKTTREDTNKMETEKQMPLSVKEMKESISVGKVETMRFKEAASSYMAENPQIDAQLKTHGIPLNTTMKVKCVGNKLQIVSPLQIKTTLDNTTNAGAYTESIVEFADMFMPGLIETFNNQANLMGAIPKKNHMMGGNTYGWKIKTDQASDLSVDPDDPSILFDPVKKLKLRTEIKEYRVGVSVTDYVMHHGRATMGDLLMLEAEARMGDMMRDFNDDLYTEQVDTAGNKILGLEAVADAAGNTEIYGKTRSTDNRLSPASADDTYEAVGGALTTAYIRGAVRKVEIAGARRENIRIIVNPKQRDALFELEDGNQNYYNAPKFGFDGQISYDGTNVIVDSSCQIDALFVVDFESYYMIVSRAPQMIGLAKVGAADSAYISMYAAIVYEQPRKIHMLDTLS